MRNILFLKIYLRYDIGICPSLSKEVQDSVKAELIVTQVKKKIFHSLCTHSCDRIRKVEEFFGLLGIWK